MKKRLLCALFAAAIVVTGAMAGCSGGTGAPSAAESTQEDSSKAEDSKAEESKAEESKAEESKNEATGSVSGSLVANKIGNVNINAADTTLSASGIIYKSDDGRYGVVSVDGKKDTGAKYAYAKEVSSNTNAKGYIVVRELTADNENVNTCGLIDKTGEMVIPCKYAGIELLNSRYAKVITADKETTDKKKAVIYFTDKSFSLTPGDDDTMYTGKWEVFDLNKKAMLKNATGTMPYNTTAKGQFVEFYNDKERNVILDKDGTEVSDGRTILSNGSYVLEVNGKSALYNTDGDRLFNFDAKDFSISAYDEPYYIAYASGNTHSLVNDKGEVVSAAFTGTIGDITPDFVRIGNKIYSLDGKEVFPEEYTTLEVDPYFGDLYRASKSDRVVFFDSTGAVIFSGNEKTDGFESYYFALYKKGEGSGYSYFNFKDKTFSIPGSETGIWFVEQREGSVNSLYELRSGSKMIDSYANFEVKRDDANGITYIFAFNSVNGQTSRGDFDIYTVSTK